MEEDIKGTVSRVESKDYYVISHETGKTVRCGLRGRFKKDFQFKKDKLYATDIAAIGDEVEFEMNNDGTGIIEKVGERRNYISRKAPKMKGASYRGERLEQVIAANVDNLFAVTSVKNPKFNNKFIDRVLVAGESSRIDCHIIINKMDLNKGDEIDAWKELYEEIGYKVFSVSAETGEGIDAIRGQMKDKKNILWGQSGVGKSSLINKIFPGCTLRVGEISSFSNKGSHTTVSGIMLNIEGNTFVIDTPGIREIDPYGITKENLGHYFKDFVPFINDCRFNTCTHQHEPACAITEAVEKEEIALERYESYLAMLNTIEDDMIF